MDVIRQVGLAAAAALALAFLLDPAAPAQAVPKLQREQAAAARDYRAARAHLQKLRDDLAKLRDEKEEEERKNEEARGTLGSVPSVAGQRLREAVRRERSLRHEVSQARRRLDSATRRWSTARHHLATAAAPAAQSEAVVHDLLQDGQGSLDSNGVNGALIDQWVGRSPDRTGSRPAEAAPRPVYTGIDASGRPVTAGEAATGADHPFAHLSDEEFEQRYRQNREQWMVLQLAREAVSRPWRQEAGRTPAGERLNLDPDRPSLIEARRRQRELHLDAHWDDLVGETMALGAEEQRRATARAAHEEAHTGPSRPQPEAPAAGSFDHLSDEELEQEVTRLQQASEEYQHAQVDPVEERMQRRVREVAAAGENILQDPQFHDLVEQRLERRNPVARDLERARSEAARRARAARRSSRLEMDPGGEIHETDGRAGATTQAGPNRQSPGYRRRSADELATELPSGSGGGDGAQPAVPSPDTPGGAPEEGWTRHVDGSGILFEARTRTSGGSFGFDRSSDPVAAGRPAGTIRETRRGGRGEDEVVSREQVRVNGVEAEGLARLGQFTYLDHQGRRRHVVAGVNVQAAVRYVGVEQTWNVTRRNVPTGSALQLLELEGQIQTFAGTEVTLQGTGGLTRTGATLHGEVGAFTGARTRFTERAQFGLLDVLRVDLTAQQEFRAGFGLQVSGDLDVDDGHAVLRHELGGAAGVGAGYGLAVDVDYRGILEDATMTEILRRDTRLQTMEEVREVIRSGMQTGELRIRDGESLGRLQGQIEHRLAANAAKPPLDQDLFNRYFEPTSVEAGDRWGDRFGHDLSVLAGEDVREVRDYVAHNIQLGNQRLRDGMTLEQLAAEVRGNGGVLTENMESRFFVERQTPRTVAEIDFRELPSDQRASIAQTMQMGGFRLRPGTSLDDLAAEMEEAGSPSLTRAMIERYFVPDPDRRPREPARPIPTDEQIAERLGVPVESVPLLRDVHDDLAQAGAEASLTYRAQELRRLGRDAGNRGAKDEERRYLEQALALYDGALREDPASEYAIRNQRYWILRDLGRDAEADRERAAMTRVAERDEEAEALAAAETRVREEEEQRRRRPGPDEVAALLRSEGEAQDRRGSQGLVGEWLIGSGFERWIRRVPPAAPPGGATPSAAIRARLAALREVQREQAARLLALVREGEIRAEDLPVETLDRMMALDRASEEGSTLSWRTLFERMLRDRLNAFDDEFLLTSTEYQRIWDDRMAAAEDYVRRLEEQRRARAEQGSGGDGFLALLANGLDGYFRQVERRNRDRDLEDARRRRQQEQDRHRREIERQQREADRRRRRQLQAQAGRKEIARLMRRNEVLRRRIQGAQRTIREMQEAQRRYPRSELDIHGHWFLGTRAGAIRKARKDIAATRAEIRQNERRIAQLRRR